MAHFSFEPRRGKIGPGQTQEIKLVFNPSQYGKSGRRKVNNPLEIINKLIDNEKKKSNYHEKHKHGTLKECRRTFKKLIMLNRLE